MAIRTLAVGNANTTQVDHRSLITALTQPANSLIHRGGLFPTSSPAGLTNVSSMTVAVGNFKGIIPNTVGAGYYLVQNDSPINLTFDPGEAGVTRTDRIIVRVYNDSQDGSGLNEPKVEYLKGQSSGSASNMPDNSLLLWEIPVPAGASSGGGGINFTSIAVDRRVYTTASGGIIPVSTNTELDAIANPYEGMAAYVKTNDVLYVHDGALFRPRGQISVANASGLSAIRNPEDGTMATTRDTDTIYRYSGSQWLRDPGTFIGEVNRDSIIGPFTTAKTVLDSYAFDAIAGERYRVVWDGSVQSTQVNDNIIVEMRWIAGTTITGSTGTAVRRAYPNANVAAKGQNVHMEKVISPNVTGKVSVAVFGVRGAGGGQITSYGSTTQQDNTIQVFVA
jgi:hypothetical protein